MTFRISLKWPQSSPKRPRVPVENPQSTPNVNQEFPKNQLRVPKKFRSLALSCEKLKKFMRNQSDTAVARFEELEGSSTDFYLKGIATGYNCWDRKKS